LTGIQLRRVHVDLYRTVLSERPVSQSGAEIEADVPRIHVSQVAAAQAGLRRTRIHISLERAPLAISYTQIRRIQCAAHMRIRRRAAHSSVEVRRPVES